jgi:LytS/YehU family sensor histidine kinase
VLFKVIQNAESELVKSPTAFDWLSLRAILLAQILFLLAKVPLVYGLFYIVNQYLYKQWSIGKTGLFTAALICVVLPFYMLIKQLLILPQVYHQDATFFAAFNFFSILYALYVLGFVSVLAISIKMLRHSIRTRNEANELRRAKLEAELRFLKAQTNPHFLFNTLNNIYALAKKQSEHTADVVLKLSKLLRFMLYEAESKAITIEKEIQVLEDYIELEKLRYPPARLALSISKQIDDQSTFIAPLLLLPFVENAFKHGASESREGSIISILISLQQGLLQFKITNTYQARMENQATSQIGLTNIRRQLELLYPNHALQIENAHSEFAVTLKVDLMQHESA